MGLYCIEYSALKIGLENGLPKSTIILIIRRVRKHPSDPFCKALYMGRCNRLPDLAYCPVSLALALRSHVSDMVEMTHRLRSSGSTFMYLYHLISIDLQSSRSFNTTLQSSQTSSKAQCTS